MALPATDNFNRTDENPLAGNWTTITGLSDMAIVSNVAVGTAGAGSNGARWNADSFSNDQYAQIAGASASLTGAFAILVRCSDSAFTAYGFSQSTSTVCRVWQIVSGVWTQIGADYSHTFSQNDIYKLEVVGQDTNAVLTPYINGTPLETRAGISGINSGYGGIRVFGSSDALDNFEAGNVATAGHPAATRLRNISRNKYVRY